MGRREPTNSGGTEGVTAKTQAGRGNACKSVGSSNPLASLSVPAIGQDLGDGRLLF
jgi:hypothetical protein